MNISKILLAGLALLAIAGCKTIDVSNGQVPDAYLAQAKKFEGTYPGQFNGVKGELVISFEGNKPVMSFSNSQGDDILNNNCHSFFGDLTKVYASGTKENPKVDGVEFAFNPGACSLMVSGRAMDISFKQSSKGMKLTLSVLQKTEHRQVCTWIPGGGTMPPIQNCTLETAPIYLYGTFSR